MRVILRKQDIPPAEKPPVVLEIVLTAGLIETNELPQLLEAVANELPAGGEEGVIISGRLPVWAFSALLPPKTVGRYLRPAIGRRGRRSNPHPRRIGRRNYPRYPKLSKGHYRVPVGGDK
jgi:hypothetical protein